MLMTAMVGVPVAGRVPAPVAGEEAEAREADVSIGVERRSSR